MNHKRLASFNALSSDEQQILQLLAVYYAPLGQTEFQALLKKQSGINYSKQS